MPLFVPKESLTSTGPDFTPLHNLPDSVFSVCSSLLSPPRHLLGSLWAGQGWLGPFHAPSTPRVCLS